MAIVNGAAIVPLFVGSAAGASGADRVLTVFLANVNTQFGDVAAVQRAIEMHDPDFVVLIEVDKQWLMRLKTLEKSYPYSVSEQRADNFGIALYSKLPFSSAEIVSLGQTEVPSIVASLVIDGKPFHLVGTHLLPPVGLQYIQWQAEQRAELVGLLDALTAPVLLVGDLNMTPWSVSFRTLIEKANLRNAGVGYGLQPTWPVQFPALLIPLDHSLYSDGIEIRQTRVGESVGSDHYPLIVDFAVHTRADIPSATKPKIM